MAVVNTAATRGRWLVRPVLTRARFIPARAGNTRSRVGGPIRDGVHPRAGGEHPSRLSASGTPSTSSPRGRGTPERTAFERVPCRFIPARAGNTSALVGHGSTSAVHPRAGGEHRESDQYGRKRDGSSPRGRGTPARPGSPPAHSRFIPARAGNTPLRRCDRSQPAVHPRAAGNTSGMHATDGA